MGKYKFILFDADGVLFDFHKAEIEALNNTLNHFELAKKDEYSEIYKEINQKIWQEFEKKLISAKELRIERFSRRIAAPLLGKIIVPLGKSRNL